MESVSTKGENTSQAILSAAYSLFAEQGFHATSMRQIARRAGVALGGIYNHFESKEQIFDRVLFDRHPYHQIMAALQSASGETMDDFVRSAAQAIVDELSRRPEFFNLVFVEISEFRGKHAPLLFQTVLPQFFPLLQRFQGPGGQLKDLPLQAIASTFFASLFAFFLTETLSQPGGPFVPDLQRLEPFIEIYLHGILTQE